MRKKIDASRTDIVRRDWERKKIKRSFIAFLIDVLNLLLFMGILLLLLVAAILFLFVSSVAAVSVVVSFVLIYLIFAGITAIIYYLNFISVKYVLQSGSIRKIEDEYTDQITGKIIIERGILSRKIKVYLASEMDRVEIRQGMLGKLLGYGSIILRETDMLQETKSFRLRLVEKPKEMAMLIQDMIDVQGQNGSQVPM